jgi:hypothetical protein
VLFQLEVEDFSSTVDDGSTPSGDRGLQKHFGEGQVLYRSLVPNSCEVLNNAAFQHEAGYEEKLIFP